LGNSEKPITLETSSLTKFLRYVFQGQDIYDFQESWTCEALESRTCDFRESWLICVVNQLMAGRWMGYDAHRAHSASVRGSGLPFALLVYFSFSAWIRYRWN
jgi:membrane peptidoglycan carboxypeptidase